MAISYINTTEVERTAKEINSLASEFQSEINNLYKRLSEVPTITKEWTGRKSEFYFDKIGKDKIKYTEIANTISELGLLLSSSIYEINSCISKNVSYERSYYDE